MPTQPLCLICFTPRPLGSIGLECDSCREEAQGMSSMDKTILMIEKQREQNGLGPTPNCLFCNSSDVKSGISCDDCRKRRFEFREAESNFFSSAVKAMSDSIDRKIIEEMDEESLRYLGILRKDSSY